MTTAVNSKINNSGGLSNSTKTVLRSIGSSNPLIKYVATDAAPASTTQASITTLAFPIQKYGKYFVEGHFPCLGDGTSGIAANLATTNDPADARILFSYSIDNAADQTELQTDLTSPNPTGVAAAITRINFSGHIFAGANDDIVNVQFGTNTGTTAAAVYKGGYIKVYEVE